jgi:hypothetical protein
MVSPLLALSLAELNNYDRFEMGYGPEVVTMDVPKAVMAQPIEECDLKAFRQHIATCRLSDLGELTFYSLTVSFCCRSSFLFYSFM